MVCSYLGPLSAGLTSGTIYTKSKDDINNNEEEQTLQAENRTIKLVI